MRRILLLATRLNGEGVGEVYTAFRLIEAMAPQARLTVVAFENQKARPLREQFADLPVEVVAFPFPGWLRRNERLAAMLKPEIPLYNRLAARWLKDRLGAFDIAHQILPRAPRYPTILRRFPLPYVIGSLGGALPTPLPFRAEAGNEPWFTRLRAIDGLRLKYDPALRASYTRADLVLGVAPYMREVLAPIPIQRFEPFLGIGVADLAPETDRPAVPGQLRLLHVGRVVRTKALRDSIRALAHLADLPGVTLTSIGSGEDLAACRAEAERLGLGSRVRFMGALPRAAIEDHYRDADALVFPSFRESMGAVLYEAMRWGLPCLTVRVGGPDYIVDDSCGLKVDPGTPETLPQELAGAIRRLAGDVDLRRRLGEGARAKIAREALWSAKAERMLALYDEVLAARG